MGWADTWAGMQPWQRAGVDALTRTATFGVASTMFAAFNGKPLGPWLAATGVVGAVQCVVQWRRHSRSETPLVAPEASARNWKKALLPWVGLAAVFTSDRWFPSVYRTFPADLWMLLVAIGAVYGVWRWIAFFWDRGAEPKR